jgi:two-component system OmpR family response regulator
VIAKPFAFTELAARVRAVRRRAMSVRLQLVHLVMDRLGHSLQRSGHAIDLSPKEFALLEFQKRHAGQPVSRRRLLSKCSV